MTNGIDQLMANAVETKVITENNTDITVIKISFDYVLNDCQKLFNKVTKRVKKLMAKCGGAAVLKNLETYRIGSSTVDIMKHYILLDADAIHTTKKRFNISDDVYNFMLYHEIGHIVLDHVSYKGHDRDDEILEQQADEFAFSKTGAKKTEKFVESLAMVAYSSYRKKKLFGGWVNLYCTMDPGVILHNNMTYLKRRFGM